LLPAELCGYAGEKGQFGRKEGKKEGTYLAEDEVVGTEEVAHWAGADDLLFGESASSDRAAGVHREGEDGRNVVKEARRKERKEEKTHIHRPRFQINQHTPRNVLPPSRLVIVHRNALKLLVRITAVLAVVVDSYSEGFLEGLAAGRRRRGRGDGPCSSETVSL
jgi:hypothetical protein